MGTLGKGRVPGTGGGLLRQPWVIALGAVTGINLGIAGLYSQPAEVTPPKSVVELHKMLDGDRDDFATALSSDRKELKDLLTDHRQQLEEALLRIKRAPINVSTMPPPPTQDIQTWVYGGAATLFFGIGLAAFVQGFRLWVNRSTPAEVVKAAVVGLVSTLLGGNSLLSIYSIHVLHELESVVQLELDFIQTHHDSESAAVDTRLKSIQDAVDQQAKAQQTLKEDLWKVLADAKLDTRRVLMNVRNDIKGQMARSDLQANTVAMFNRLDEMELLRMLLVRKPDMQPILARLDRYAENASGQAGDAQNDINRMFGALLARDTTSDADTDAFLAHLDRFAENASGKVGDGQNNVNRMFGALLARDTSPLSDSDLQAILARLDRYAENASGKVGDERNDITRMFGALLARETSPIIVQGGGPIPGPATNEVYSMKCGDDDEQIIQSFVVGQPWLEHNTDQSEDTFETIDSSQAAKVAKAIKQQESGNHRLSAVVLIGSADRRKHANNSELAEKRAAEVEAEIRQYFPPDQRIITLNTEAPRLRLIEKEAPDFNTKRAVQVCAIWADSTAAQ
jgi:hypothetical protein